MKPTKILMVCLGNICRSPLAEGILQSKLPIEKFQVDSAGTANYHVGEAPDYRSVLVAKNHGIDISRQRCRQIKTTDFEKFDSIFVMDKSNYENVIKIAPNLESKNKVYLILNELNPNLNQEVPDPYYGSINDFEEVFQLLDKVCDVIVEKIK